MTTLRIHGNACKTHHIIDHSFTGKERDPETGYSYFGARYYDSDLSGLFLSVDPMAEVSSFEKGSGLLRTSSSLRTPQELVPSFNKQGCLLERVVIPYIKKGCISGPYEDSYEATLSVSTTEVFVIGKKYKEGTDEEKIEKHHFHINTDATLLPIPHK